MKRVTFSRGLISIAFGAAVLLALMLAAPSTAGAMHCDPEGEVCVGLPNGPGPCGQQGEGCCYGTDCGDGLVCETGICKQAPTYIRYHLICNSGFHTCLSATSYQSAEQIATQDCSSQGGVSVLTAYPYGGTTSAVQHALTPLEIVD